MSEIRWVRDVPSDPIMQSQWQQTPIPWCITHDNQQSKVRSNFCCESWNGLQQPHCTISTGGPDHKWWKDA